MPTQHTVLYRGAGDASVVAHCEGKDSNACAVHVAAAPPPSGGDYPNLPGSMTALFLYKGRTQLSGGWSSQGMDLGVGINFFPNDQYPATDPTSPVEPPSVFQQKWATGTPPAYGGGLSKMWADNPPTAYQEFYEACWMKVGLGTDFEGSPGKCFGYWGVGQGSTGTNTLYAGAGVDGKTVVGWDPVSGNPLYADFSITWAMQNVVSWAIYGTGYMRVGRWYRHELYCKCNDVGQSNGILRGWLTDCITGQGATTPYINVTDRVFRTVANPLGFRSKHFCCVYGGFPQSYNKGRDDFMNIARFAGWGRGAGL